MLGAPPCTPAAQRLYLGFGREGQRSYSELKRYRRHMLTLQELSSELFQYDTNAPRSGI